MVRLAAGCCWLLARRKVEERLHGRTSHTLELEELGRYFSYRLANLHYKIKLLLPEIANLPDQVAFLYQK